MKHAIALLVAMSAHGLADAARAEPSAADRASARAMLDEGYALLEKGDANGALKLFLAADATMNVPTTALAVARAEAASGKLLEAHEKLVTIIRAPHSAGEPTPFTRARDDAAIMFKELDERVPTLRIEVTGAPNDDATITLDEEKLPRETNGAPRRANPGHHSIRVEIRGKIAVIREIDLAEHETQSIVIPIDSHDVESHEHDARTDQDHGSYALAYAGFGVGAAGVVLGSVTGILAITTKNSSDVADNCVANQCSPAAHDAVYRAKTFATTSTVAFIVGGVGAGVGIFGLFVGGGSGTASTRASIEPYVGISCAGVHGTF